MSKPNRRRVRMDQFKNQLAEQALPEDRLVPVDLPDGQVVWIKLPILLDDDDDFMERLTAASTSEETALVVLSGADTPAEEQWETWKAAGYTANDLAQVFAAETAYAQERLQQFRYKG